MFFERPRDSSSRSPMDAKASGSRMWSLLGRANLKLAAFSISFPRRSSCMTPLGDGSPFLCGSFSGSSARTISCSFRFLADKAQRRSQSRIRLLVVHLVMHGARLHFDQEILVEVVVFRPA